LSFAQYFAFLPLSSQYTSVIQIQAFARQVISQNRFFAMLEDEYSAIACQACIRGWLARVDMERKTMACLAIQNLYFLTRHPEELAPEPELELPEEAEEDTDTEDEFEKKAEPTILLKQVEVTVPETTKDKLAGFSTFENFNFDTESDFLGFDPNGGGKEFASFDNLFETPGKSSDAKEWTSVPEESTPASSLEFSSPFAFANVDDFNLSSFAEETMSGKKSIAAKDIAYVSKEAPEIKTQPRRLLGHAPPPPPPHPPSRSSKKDRLPTLSVTLETSGSGGNIATEKGVRKGMAASPPPPPPRPPTRRSSSKISNQAPPSSEFVDSHDRFSSPVEAGSSPTYSSSMARPGPVRRAVSDVVRGEDAAPFSRPGETPPRTSQIHTQGANLMNGTPPPIPHAKRSSIRASPAEQRRAATVTPPPRALHKRAQSVGSMPLKDEAVSESAESNSPAWKGWNQENEKDDQEDEFANSKRRPKMRSSLLQKDSLGQKLKKNLIPSGFGKSKRSSSRNVAGPPPGYVPPNRSYVPPRMLSPVAAGRDVQRPSGIMTPSPSRKAESAKSTGSSQMSQLVTPRSNVKSSERMGKRMSAKKIVSPDSVQQTSNWG
jgi:hypothetical protein